MCIFALPTPVGMHECAVCARPEKAFGSILYFLETGSLTEP